MENFQIEQQTSRPKRNVVAVTLGLLGLVGVALLLTPGPLAGLEAMPWQITSRQGHAVPLLPFGSARLSTVRCDFRQNILTFGGCSEAVVLGICHGVRAVGRLAGRWLRWRCLRSRPRSGLRLLCPAARDIRRRPMDGRGTVDLAPGGGYAQIEPAELVASICFRPRDI